MSRDLKTNCLIIKKVNFRDTSLIIDVLTPEYGVIKVMAKGVRKNNKVTGILELLNELEMDLYKNPSSDWYIFKSAQLINANLFNIKLHKSILMQAAIEIIRQIIITVDDSKAVYELLTQYLQYIKTVPKNGIVIFWRFMLKLCKIIGIELNVYNCIECSHNNKFVAYFPQKHGFICDICYRPIYDEQVIRINDIEADLIRKLPNIGQFIDEISIPKSIFKHINKIFVIHLSEHFNKNMHLKSVELL